MEKKCFTCGRECETNLRAEKGGKTIQGCERCLPYREPEIWDAFSGIPYEHITIDEKGTVRPATR